MVKAQEWLDKNYSPEGTCIREKKILEPRDGKIIQIMAKPDWRLRN